MQTRQWRAVFDSRRTILTSHRVASCALAAVTLAISPMSGCAPVHLAADLAEAADAGPRKRPRTKPRVASPKAALLAPQAPPDCGEAKTAEPNAKPMARAMAGKPAPAADALPNTGGEPADPEAVLALRIKLEYERECYRQAEARVRARLQELQGSVKETIKPDNSAERPSD
jgi:hypothetical protein